MKERSHPARPKLNSDIFNIFRQLLKQNNVLSYLPFFVFENTPDKKNAIMVSTIPTIDAGHGVEA